MVDFVAQFSNSRVASGTFWLDESKFLKVEDFVRYHLNYPSYLDLPLGRDPFAFVRHVHIKILSDESHWHYSKWALDFRFKNAMLKWMHWMFYKPSQLMFNPDDTLLSTFGYIFYIVLSKFKRCFSGAGIWYDRCTLGFLFSRLLKWTNCMVWKSF